MSILTQTERPGRTANRERSSRPAHRTRLGVFVVYTGYPAAFAVTGMLVLAALVPALRDRTAPAAQGFPVGASTSS